jgi:hypothetical protein
MYSPCRVFPYLISDGQWYTLEAVSTQTFAGPSPGAGARFFSAGEAEGVGLVLPPFESDVVLGLLPVVGGGVLSVPWAAAAVAASSMPPCWAHALRLPWGDVMPSLQVTGAVSSARLGPDSAIHVMLSNSGRTAPEDRVVPKGAGVVEVMGGS